MAGCTPVMWSTSVVMFIVNMLTHHCHAHLDMLAVAETVVQGVEGGDVSLACDVVQLHSNKDRLILVLWYRNRSKQPFYTYDARGHQPHKGQHTVDDRLIPGAAASFQLQPPRLILTRLTGEDQGLYVCRAEYEQSPSRMVVLNLSVIVPPSMPRIYNSSGSEMVHTTPALSPGDDLFLTCEVSGGRPPPELVWHFRSKLIDRTFVTTSAGIVRNSVHVKQLRRHDLLATISCTALANSRHLTSDLTRSLLVDLLLPPAQLQLLDASQQRPLLAGRDHQLSCRSSGARPAAVVNWRVNDLPVTSASVHVQNSTESGVTVSTLTLTPDRSRDQVKVTCFASNPLLSASYTLSKSIVMPVHYTPSVEIRMGSMVRAERIVEGSDVYFDCHVTANPDVTSIDWQFEGASMVTERRVGVVVTAASLALAAVSSERTGRYTCLATNSVGSRRSTPLYLQVLHAPRCANTNTTRTIRFVVGRAVTIDCHLMARPANVHFKWDVNVTERVLVPDTSRHTARHLSTTTIARTPITGFVVSGSTSRLRYTATSSAPRQLRCWASNSVGLQRQACTFFLLEAGRPSGPSECVVDNVTATSLWLHCSAGDDGGVAQMFRLSVRPGSVSTAASSSDVVRVMTSRRARFHVDRLRPGVYYLLQVSASNAQGSSEVQHLTVSTLTTLPHRTAFSTSASAGKLAAVVCAAVITLATLLVWLAALWRRRHRHLPDRSSSTAGTNSGTSPADLQTATTERLQLKRHEDRENERQSRTVSPDLLFAAVSDNMCSHDAAQSAQQNSPHWFNSSATTADHFVDASHAADIHTSRTQIDSQKMWCFRESGEDGLDLADNLTNSYHNLAARIDAATPGNSGVRGPSVSQQIIPRHAHISPLPGCYVYSCSLGAKHSVV